MISPCNLFSSVNNKPPCAYDDGSETSIGRFSYGQGCHRGDL